MAYQIQSSLQKPKTLKVIDALVESFNIHQYRQMFTGLAKDGLKDAYGLMNSNQSSSSSSSSASIYDYHYYGTYLTHNKRTVKLPYGTQGYYLNARSRLGMIGLQGNNLPTIYDFHYGNWISDSSPHFAAMTMAGCEWRWKPLRLPSGHLLMLPNGLCLSLTTAVPVPATGGWFDGLNPL